MTTTTHASPRSPAEQHRLEQAMTELFERTIRFNQVLGLTVESCDPAGPRIRFDMRADLVGHAPSGRLHGGVTSAVLDALGGFALMVAIGAKHPGETTEEVMHRLVRVGTIDLRIDFLRPGVGAFFLGRAQVTRLGGRIGSTQMSLQNDHGTLVATGAASYVIS